MSDSLDKNVEVLQNLLKLSKSEKEVRMHKSGIEYTAIMNSFLLLMISASESLITLYLSFSKDWFPAIVGFNIVRQMFEIDLTGRYINLEPQKHAQLYVEYDRVIEYKKMNCIYRNLESENPLWRNLLNTIWSSWNKDKDKIEKNFNDVKHKFGRYNNKNKWILFQNWSGKNISEMAKEVDRKEMYDLFYTTLSNYTHSNAMTLRSTIIVERDKIKSTMQTKKEDIGYVFEYAIIFFTSFLELFGEDFKVWNTSEINECQV